jgi:hypothetical protein
MLSVVLLGPLIQQVLNQDLAGILMDRAIVMFAII